MFVSYEKCTGSFFVCLFEGERDVLLTNKNFGQCTPCILSMSYSSYFVFLKYFFNNISFTSYRVLLAVPVLQFTSELKNQEAVEGDKATLSCETSTPDAHVTWKKGRIVLSEGDKYSIQKNGTIQTLVIHKLTVMDAGEYVCEIGDKQSKATLSIKGDEF